MKWLFGLVLTLVLLPSVSYAEWVHTFTANDGTLAYILHESKTILRDGIIQAWTKNDTRKSTDPSLKNILDEKRLMQYNCITKQFRVLDMLVTYKDNTTKVYNPAPTSWYYIVPDTLSEAEYVYLCGRNLF